MVGKKIVVGEQAAKSVSVAEAAKEKRLINSLRPLRLDEYIGQAKIIQSMRVATTAALKRAEALDHVLLHGPPGLGKTTLANIIAREMQSRLYHTSGPALERPADVVGVLSNLKQNDVFFIDEIHRLSRAVEEYLYSAMEDFRVDFMTGQGAFARTINLPLQHFTLIGSTTRAGMLSAPLRERFGLQYHLGFYAPEEIVQVVTRSAKILGLRVDNAAAKQIAKRARGTPRIANRLLKRVRDYAEVNHGGLISADVAIKALDLEGVDSTGLERLDRRYLQVVAVNYGGGPTGIEAIAASINEEPNTLVDMVEPFLLKVGFLIRTHQGRKITSLGRAHIGEQDDSQQANLL